MRCLLLGLILAALLRAAAHYVWVRWWRYDGRGRLEMKGRSYW